MRTLNTAVAIALLALTSGPSTPPKADRELEIIGLDYAFQMPPNIGAGRTVFRFYNKGKVDHELNISLLKNGASVERFMEAVRADAPTGEFREGPVGVLFAGPGKRSSGGLSTNLLPGRTYVVICINRDTPKAQRHYAMGMYTVIVPSPGPTTANGSNTSPVDTIVGNDYAFRYPRSLAPGHHSIAFVNEGKFRHEAIVLLLKKGVTLEQALKTQKEGGDVDPLIETDFGLLHAPAQASSLGWLEVDLLPGREYAIICTFTNDPKSPPHVMLGMFGSIHVTGTAPPR